MYSKARQAPKQASRFLGFQVSRFPGLWLSGGCLHGCLGVCLVLNQKQKHNKKKRQTTTQTTTRQPPDNHQTATRQPQTWKPGNLETLDSKPQIQDSKNYYSKYKVFIILWITLPKWTSRFPGFQVSRFPGFQVSKFRGLQVSKKKWLFGGLSGGLSGRLSGVFVFSFFALGIHPDNPPDNPPPDKPPDNLQTTPRPPQTTFRQPSKPRP